MRMWHIDLLPYLPHRQLMGIPRELSAIIGELEKTGKLTRERGYLLVTPLNYIRKEDLITYIKCVKRAGAGKESFMNDLCNRVDKLTCLGKEPIREWHDARYLRICYYNLLEKFLCGGFSEEEYERLEEGTLKILGGQEDASL